MSALIVKAELAYLFGYSIMTIWSEGGYTSRTPARFVPMRQQRPFRDKLSSQEGLRLPYICESMWKRWMGLQQFWWRWRRKDGDGFCLFLPSLFFPSPIMYAHTHVWPRYAKSLNMAVKRRRRVCQYGEYGRPSSLLLFLSSLRSRWRMEILTLTFSRTIMFLNFMIDNLRID